MRIPTKHWRFPLNHDETTILVGIQPNQKLKQKPRAESKISALFSCRELDLREKEGRSKESVNVRYSKGLGRG
jgi:hypothetical protein